MALQLIYAKYWIIYIIKILKTGLFQTKQIHSFFTNIFFKFFWSSANTKWKKLFNAKKYTINKENQIK